MKKDNKNKYWKSIEEFSNPKPFREAAKNEFPESIMQSPSKISRKKFLTIMGASIALAGLSGCRKPVQKILPYVDQPEGSIPGIPKYYSTTVPFGLNSFGVVVENHEGRPTHIEGNSRHSSSLGATNGMVQASILDLYDPDRSKIIKRNGKRSSWKKIAEQLSAFKKNKIAVLSHSFSSPSIYKLKLDLEKQGVSWVCYDPISNENELLGISKALNKTPMSVFANYSFDKKKVNRILSIDSDFLNQDLNSIKNTKEFSKGRKVRSSILKADKDNYKKYKKAKMNRLYVVEGSLTTTGSMADHRKSLKQSEINDFVFKLYDCFNNNSSSDNFIYSVYKDLKNNKGVIRGGSRLSPECHELIVRMNEMLGNNGLKYIPFSETKAACPSSSEDYKKLIKKMDKGDIDCICILDSNPVYFSKNNEGFIQALSKVSNSVHIGCYYDETASKCNWHIPKTHYLESWGDCRSLDGTVSIIQPMISPLYTQAYSDLDFLFLLIDPLNLYEPLEKSYNFIYSQYSLNWTKSLYNGVVKKGNYKGLKRIKTRSKKLNPKKINTGIEVAFSLSNHVYDGRFANNAWLQESPDSISKVAWDNVALISSKTAEENKIKNKELISLTYNNSKVEIPAWILPGQADNQISVQAGYGRDFESRVAKSVGKNIFPLMNGAQYNNSVKIKGTGILVEVACTQDHHGMDEGDDFANSEVQSRLPDIFRDHNLEDYKTNGGKKLVAKVDKEKHLTMKNGEIKTLYDNPYQKYYEAEAKPYDKPYDPTDPPQWGMTIDLNSCTGCNACEIACQSENNIPTVGKEQILLGREMSWVRVDRYFRGDDPDNPAVAFQPVACVHCENAPCEQVCPVAATVHDKEGLNAMVYNRCIGTRYCANNCPYKVRRFNYFNNTYDTPEVVQMAHNPDVTIRFRGVMEKCTYCVQRIKEVEQKSKVQKKNMNDLSLKVACQTACPADCIDFGNIKDSTSDVYLTKHDDRDYSLLAQLNTRPRTTYLAKLRNPNKEII